MFINVLQKLGVVFRRFLPAVSTVFFILLGVLAWPLPFAGSVAPSLGLAAIYYWAIYRPDLFRPLIVFILGFLNDMIHFLPPGLSAFVFTGAYQLAFSHRRFFVGQTFFMLWFGFALIALLSVIVNWGVLSLVNGAFVASFPVFMQFILSVAAFPLPVWVLIRIHRGFLSQG